MQLCKKILVAFMFGLLMNKGSGWIVRSQFISVKRKYEKEFYINEIITYECNIHNIIFFKLKFKIIKLNFLMQIMYFLKHGEKNKQKIFNNIR